MPSDLPLALRETSHRRFNPLRGDWTIVSPHRTQRPWQGQREKAPAVVGLKHDPTCFLCAGNTRANGERNPQYEATYVFDNDYAALKSDAPNERFEDGLLLAEGESGVCRVVCFSPRHDLTLARMSVGEIVPVVEAWIAEAKSLAARSDIASVQIFENRGEIMGCSNPHPHGQIWASRHTPNELDAESRTQSAYFAKHGKPMLVDYLERELATRERIVFENDGFVCLVPFWAVWPFETMLLPKRRLGGFEDFGPADVTSLAQAFSELTIRYDNLFETSFPYSMGFHQRPADGAAHPEWQLHAHFYPPLLRSASVKKFMVGYEMLASPQRGVPRKPRRERLRALPTKHYLD